jgi:hypothetical protein
VASKEPRRPERGGQRKSHGFQRKFESEKRKKFSMRPPSSTEEMSREMEKSGRTIEANTREHLESPTYAAGNPIRIFRSSFAISNILSNRLPDVSPPPPFLTFHEPVLSFGLIFET